MDRDLFVEEIKKKVNSKFNPKPNEYQTAAPIVGETNAPNIYLTVADIEKLKVSIETYSKDYTTQFNNLLVYIERVSEQYAILISKIDSLKAYIENLEETVNPNKGKINGEEVEDITYYTRRDANSYYQRELMPKLTSLYENSISYASLLINNEILDIVNEIYKTDIGKKIITDDFLKTINYYQHFNTLVNSMDAFNIEKPRLSTGEIDDNGTVQIIRTDPSKYSNLKAITKGNDIVEVTAVGTNNNAGGIILETAGKNNNLVYDKNKIPIITEIIKSDFESIKNSWISNVFSHYSNRELDDRVSSVLYELDILLNISIDENSLLFKNGDTTITNSKNGKVYVNKVQADFSVDVLKIYNGSTCVVSTAGDLWVVGSNYNNRLGLGKDVETCSNWKKAIFSDERTSKVEYVWIYDNFTLVRTKDYKYYIAGNVKICECDKKENFHYIGTYHRFEYNEGTLYFFSEDSSELFACGENYYGECGVNSEEDYIINPVKVEFSESLYPSSHLKFYGKSVYLFANITKRKDSYLYMSVYGFGRNDHKQLGFTSTDTMKPKLIMNNVNTRKSIPNFFIDDNDDLYVFGDNINNRLGISGNRRNIELTLLYKTDKKNLLGLKNNVQKIVRNEENTMILTIDGNLYICGLNKCGELGVGNKNPVSKLKLHPDEKLFNKISDMELYGDKYNFALLYTNEIDENNNFRNKVLVAGNNIDGMLGLPETNILEFSDIGLNKGYYVSNTFNHNLLFIDTSNLWGSKYYAAGLNQYGQLGTGKVEKRISLFELPVENGIHILPLSTVYILTKEGDVYAAGLNSSGQVGIDSDENFVPTFTKIEGLKDIVSMYSDNTTAYFIDKNHDLFVVGSNSGLKSGVESIFDNIIRTPMESGFSIEQMTNGARINDTISVLEKEIEDEVNNE